MQRTIVSFTHFPRKQDLMLATVSQISLFTGRLEEGLIQDDSPFAGTRRFGMCWVITSASPWASLLLCLAVVHLWFMLTTGDKV